MESFKKLGIWLKASRLPAQSYLLLPLLVGSFYGAYPAGLDGSLLLMVLLFGIFDHLYIIFLNDYADRATDKLNRDHTLFSGGSRVLVENELSPSLIKNAGVAAGIGCVAVSLVLAIGRGRYWLLVLCAAALLIFWMYSYRPLRLSYRGGGELLQVMGLGLVLPLYGYYAQRGLFEGIPWLIILSLLPAHLACALTTALPDQHSDKLSDKRTLVVLAGNRITRILVIGLNCLSIVLVYLWFSGTSASKYPLSVHLGAWKNAILAIFMAALFLQVISFKTRPGSRALYLFLFAAVFVVLGLNVLYLLNIVWV